jgi:NAD(P)-dependent dehydrogenase (short-subunit alcohol dehydrogenase family)
LNTLTDLADLSGRRALITGGAGHLGRVMAHTLAGMGADLVLVDLDSEKLEETGEELNDRFPSKVRTFFCDLESEDERGDFAKTVLETGGINILINNAAFVGTSELHGWAEPFEKQTLVAWRRAMEVNLTAAFHLSQLFAPSLKVNRGSSIINIGSIYGSIAPDWSLYEGTDMTNPAAYGVSKAGLVQLTKWLATTVAPDIRVNSLSLGGVERGQPQEFIGRYIKKTPLGRMACEADIIGPIAFLSSDMSSYVTGHNLSVDGGWATS